MESNSVRLVKKRKITFIKRSSHKNGTSLLIGSTSMKFLSHHSKDPSLILTTVKVTDTSQLLMESAPSKAVTALVKRNGL